MIKRFAAPLEKIQAIIRGESACAIRTGHRASVGSVVWN
jgi:hypothetical protein